MKKYIFAIVSFLVMAISINIAVLPVTCKETYTDDEILNHVLGTRERVKAENERKKFAEETKTELLTKITLMVSEPKDTEGFVYTDSESNVTFIVPANWEEKEFSKDREVIDVMFSPTEDPEYTIIYGSFDIWEQLTASDKVAYSRVSIDNSIITKSEIAEMYNVSADKISKVKYNGVEYYKIEATTSSEIYGSNYTVTITQLIYINNGWGYTYQFSGTDEDEYYDDFENLLNSVKYQEETQNVLYQEDENNTPDFNYLSSFDFGMYYPIISFLLITVICLVIIAIKVKSVIKRKKASPNKPILVDDNEPENIVEAKIKSSLEQICENCGHELLPEGEFCHVCGSKKAKKKGNSL